MTCYTFEATGGSAKFDVWFNDEDIAHAYDGRGPLQEVLKGWAREHFLEVAAREGFTVDDTQGVFLRRNEPAQRYEAIVRGRVTPLPPPEPKRCYLVELFQDDGEHDEEWIKWTVSNHLEEVMEDLMDFRTGQIGRDTYSKIRITYERPRD